MKTHKLILGTVQLGLPYGINSKGAKMSSPEAESILSVAYNAGIKVLDSAEAYGNAHQIIGDFHQKFPEKRFKVITKIPKEISSGLTERVNGYLEELKVENLEALMFHSLSTLQANPELITEPAELKKQVVINQIGVSVYTNDELNHAINIKEIDLIQLPFNVLDNWNLRGDLITEAKKKGKKIHTRSAFLQGILLRDPNDDHKILKALRNELLELQNIAEQEYLSMASLALNYCLQQNQIDNVLIGVDNTAQLAQNLAVAAQKISDAAVAMIDKIEVKNPDLLNPSLWN